MNFNSNNIDHYHKEITDAFRFNMRELKYHELPPSSLIPREDKSVRYVGSATSIFKKHFINKSVPDRGYFIIQKCLRTRNLKSFFVDEVNPEWASYFTMLGAIVRPDKISSLLDGVLNTLFSLHVSNERIMINVFFKDVDLINLISDKRYQGRFLVNIDNSENNLIKYRHKYGMDNIYGRNFNLSIKDEDRQVFKDVGNIIVIETDGVSLAVEMGIGVSTLLARIFSLKNSIEASLVSKIIPFEYGLKSKFSDALSSIVAMFRSGVNPGSKGREYLLKVYIIALVYLCDKVNVSFSKVKEYCDRYELEEYGNVTDIVDRLLKYMLVYKNKIPTYLKYDINRK
ncbi:MAG: hypothetical protein ACOZAJ_03660 [Patescibacteria group bacterium]